MPRTPEMTRASGENVLPLNVDSIRGIDQFPERIKDEKKRELATEYITKGKTMFFKYADYYLSKLTSAAAEPQETKPPELEDTVDSHRLGEAYTYVRYALDFAGEKIDIPQLYLPENATIEQVERYTADSLRVKHQLEEVTLQYVFSILGDYRRLVVEERMDPQEALRRLNVPPEVNLRVLIEKVGQLPGSVPERDQLFFPEK